MSGFVDRLITFLYGSLYSVGPETREDTVFRIPDSDSSRRSEPILNFRLIQLRNSGRVRDVQDLRGGKMGANIYHLMEK